MAQYTTQQTEGQTVWFKDGEQVAHYPEMVLHTVLRRLLAQAEEHATVTREAAEAIAAQMMAAYPMVVEDTPAQHEARLTLVALFQEYGLLP